MLANNIIADVLRLSVEEVASLSELRGSAVNANNLRLKNLKRDYDDRILAHFDCLAIAGEQSWTFCEAALEEPSSGAVFTAAVQALEESRVDRLEKLLALAEAVPRSRAGLSSALGWVERGRLQGFGLAFLGSSTPFERAVGLAACSMHRVDPGLHTGGWLEDDDLCVRADALRLVGEIGCQKAIRLCAATLTDTDPECRFWAAWSCILGGARHAALDALADVGLDAGHHFDLAFPLVLQAMSIAEAHCYLQKLALIPASKYRLIEGSGIAGDPSYIPWLLSLMREKTHARSAAWAFCLITGLDIVQAGLDAKPAGVVESGPNENPDDPNVDMDPQGNMPWPDADLMDQWWSANGSRFSPGNRYFVGAPITRENCLNVLASGYQRQRNLAASHLCLLEPGTPLFHTGAPSWRQQRQLSQM